MQTTEIPPADHRADSIFLKSAGIRRWTRSTALIVTLVALWLLTHRYLGLDGDAKLYAFQALARFDPSLGADLYLQFGSQDRFTIFSPLYAWCIQSFGLQSAEMLLAIVCKVWFFAASWFLVRAISNYRIAFLATTVLIVIVGRYGAYSIFQYSEDWVTARSLAEALVITGFALYFHNFRVAGLLITVSALCVHPLMALPGVLLLMCLLTPTRTSLLGAAAGISATLLVAAAAVLLPAAAQVFTVMDREWLEVVRERSLHLFPQLWRFEDWKLNGKPFLALTMSALATNDVRVRKLCTAAMTVGASGVAVAIIAGFIGPVAILLQGQSWRWVWVTTFTAILLLLPTAVRVWREEHCGPLCALLLMCGWISTAIDGALCMAVALGLWLIRNRISVDLRRYLRWSAVVLGVVVIVWMMANCWNIGHARQAVSGRDPFIITQIRGFMTTDGLAVLLAGSLITWIGRSNSSSSLALFSLAVAAACAFVVPGTFKNVLTIGSMTRSVEFSDWRAAIPPGSNVFVAPSPTSASFAWFMLERPDYLSADQSAGVVFSRLTALEVRRRAALVLPIWDTNWRLKRRQPSVHGNVAESSSSPRPLTKESLIAVCRDPKLGFVVAKENVGFNPVRHSHAGPWQDWQLYDCRAVNSLGPAA
jgi:hypothetical protein